MTPSDGTRRLDDALLAAEVAVAQDLGAAAAEVPESVLELWERRARYVVDALAAAVRERRYPPERYESLVPPDDRFLTGRRC